MAAFGGRECRSRGDGLGRAGLPSCGEKAAGRRRLEHLLHHGDRHHVLRSNRIYWSGGKRREILVRLADRRASGKAARQMGDRADAGGAQGDCQGIAEQRLELHSARDPRAVLPQLRLAQERHRRARHARGGAVLEHGEGGSHLMLAYIARRLASTVLVMGIVAVFVFLLLHLSPGDPAAIIAGDNATGDQIAAIRRQLGLDDALPVQFFRWVIAVLQGDLGISIFSNEPVAKLIGQRVEPTLSLALTTLIVAVTLAVSFGVLAAWKVGTWIDRALMVVSVIGFSVPVFVVGYMLIYVFSINLRWLPVQGYMPIDQGLWPWIERLILPSIALGLAYVALIARITRTSMLEVLAEDYIRTANAKGVATRSVLLKHALKNAGVPIVTVIGIGVALLIGGVVITETVFNIPGVGRLVVDAISKRDYPLIQGVILVFSGVYVLVNLLVDMSYTLLDPRIRY